VVGPTFWQNFQKKGFFFQNAPSLDPLTISTNLQVCLELMNIYSWKFKIICFKQNLNSDYIYTYIFIGWCLNSTNNKNNKSLSFKINLNLHPIFFKVRWSKVRHNFAFE
jgi:hypothetical protein